LSVDLNVDLLLLGGGSGLGSLLLAVEELVNGLSPELGALDGLGVDLSALLLAETLDLGSGSLGEVLVVRLGDLLLLLGSGGGYGSLTLSGSPSTITGLDSGSLGGVLLILSVLLTLLLGVKLSLSLVSSPAGLDLLLGVGKGSASSLKLPSLTTVVGGSALVADGLGRVSTGSSVLDRPVLSGTLGVGIGTSVVLLGGRNSLAVKASGVLESFLNALGAGGTSVPWLSGGSGVVSSSSVGVTSRGRSGDSSLRSRGGGSLGLSSGLGLSGCGRWLSVVT